MSWSTSELRVRLAPLNRFKPSSKIFYWPFQGGTSFVDLLCFCSVLCLLCFVHVCLYVLRGHLLGKGWPLGSRLWCLLWVCHFPIGILGQVWYLIVSIPDLCNLTYFDQYIIILNTLEIRNFLSCEWFKPLCPEFSPLSFSPSNESHKFEVLGTKGLFQMIENSNYREVDMGKYNPPKWSLSVSTYLT